MGIEIKLTIALLMLVFMIVVSFSEHQKTVFWSAVGVIVSLLLLIVLSMFTAIT